jgi:RNA polymerase sigma factor (sigma-70 family)
MAPRRTRAHGRPHDPAETVGKVLAEKRDVLLRVHRHRLQREDLEDCLSQAALELIGRVRGNDLHDERHIANALEQKFLSRVMDRQRAVGGRSAIVAATHDALRLDVGHADGEDRQLDIAGPDGDPSDAVVSREELERLHEVAAELTADQRLVLACQVSLGMECAEFCERFGWSAEKFRKVAQRARARLRTLVAEYERGERCLRLDADVVAYAAHAASAQQVALVRQHLANCAGCAALVRDLRLTSDRVAALLPVPVLAKATAVGAGALGAKVAGAWRALTSYLASGPSTASGGSVGGGLAGVTKAAIAALCVVGAVGAGEWALPGHAPDRRGPAARQPGAAAPRPLATEPAVRLTEPTSRPVSTRVVSESRAQRRRTKTRRAVPAAVRQQRPARRSGQATVPEMTAPRAASADRRPKSNAAATTRSARTTAPSDQADARGEFSVE